MFRTRLKTHSGSSFFIQRNKLGQIKKFQSIGHSLKKDRSIHSLHKPKHRRQGFMGDY